MTERAPFALFRDMLLAPLTDALGAEREAMRPISSGKRVETPSDDPLDFIRARALDAEVENSKQFLVNIQDAIRMLDYADARVSEITDRLQRARVLALQAANDIYATGDRRMIAEEVDTVLEDMVEIANGRTDGMALFGGAETDGVPFLVERDANGRIDSVVYRGDRVEAARRIGAGTTELVEVTLVGSRIFQVDPYEVRSGLTVATDAAPLAGLLPAGETNVAIEVNGRRIVLDLAVDDLQDVAQKINDSIAGVTASVEAVGAAFALRIASDETDQVFLRDLGTGRFLQRMQIVDGIEPMAGNEHANAVAADVTIFSVLRDLREDLLTGENEAVIRAHLADLSTALDSNIEVRATVGGRRRRVEDAMTREEAYQVVYKRFLSEARDADFAKATTDLAQTRTKLQAAAEAAKGVAPVTLAQFI